MNGGGSRKRPGRKDGAISSLGAIKVLSFLARRTVDFCLRLCMEGRGRGTRDIRAGESVAGGRIYFQKEIGGSQETRGLGAAGKGGHGKRRKLGVAQERSKRRQGEVKFLRVSSSRDTLKLGAGGEKKVCRREVNNNNGEKKRYNKSRRNQNIHEYVHRKRSKDWPDSKKERDRESFNEDGGTTTKSGGGRRVEG